MTTKQFHTRKRLQQNISILLVCILILAINTKLIAQLNIGTETIIENEAYAVHSTMYNGSTVMNTVNVFLIKGVNDSVWIFGSGYGEPTDVRFYRNNNNINTGGQLFDVQRVDSIIQNKFQLSNLNAKIQFITPHFHLDHINQEFFTALANNYNYNLTKIYIHTNDYNGATCNSQCCGSLPCNQTSPNFGAPYNVPWTSNTLSKFHTLGSLNDTCNTELMKITTSYGYWSVLKADIQHTNGSINLANNLVKIKILGSEPGTECNTPNDWQIIEAHGNINISPIILTSLEQIESPSQFKIYPTPSDGNFIIDFNNQNQKNIWIADITGKIIYTSSTTQDKKVVNIKATSGLYLVYIYDNNTKHIMTQKLIIE